MATKMEKRNEKIVELREKGWTWKAIGDKFGISGVRAYQVYQRETA